MRTLVLTVSAFILGLAFPASAEDIKCPVKLVRADLGTKLPDGWWYTPTEGELKGVRIQTIGGQATLMCLYSAFGGQVAVMRKAPENVKCQANTKLRQFHCK